MSQDAADHEAHFASCAEMAGNFAAHAGGAAMQLNDSFKPKPLRCGSIPALGMQKRPLYLVRYKVQPLPGTDNFAHSAGAFVNVWTEATSEQQALAIAAREVQEAGWRIDSLEAVHPTVRDDYADDAPGLEYFEQALIDGIVLVFHSWQEGTQH